MNCLFSILNILNAPKKFEKESKQTMLADVTPLSMAPCQQQTNLDHTKTPPQGYLQNNKQIWNSERTSNDLYKPGMHGAVFFCFWAGRGGAEEKNFGAGQGVKSSSGAG